MHANLFTRTCISHQSRQNDAKAQVREDALFAGARSDANRDAVPGMICSMLASLCD
jgi:hypothetical protein